MERTDGKRTKRIEDQFTSAVGLTLIDGHGRALSCTSSCSILPQAVAARNIGVARNLLVVGDLTLVHAGSSNVDAARLDSAFELSVDGCAEG